MPRFIFNTILARGVSTFVNFLIALLIARHAGPVIKGEVTLLITTIWFVMFFSNILGGQALVYLIPRNKAGLLVIPAYLWSVVVSVLCFIILKWVHLIHACHVPAIAILSFLSSIIGINQTVLLAREKIRVANALTVLPLILQVAGIVICFYHFHIADSYAYIYASLAAYVFTLLASIYFTRRLVPFRVFLADYSVHDMKVSFRYGLLFQLVEVFQLLNLRYYFYQLALQEGSRYLGIYSIGISILEAVWIIPRSISTVHYVSTSNSDAVKNQAIDTVRLIKTGLVLCLTALIIIWLVPGQVYTIVFGPGFKDVKHSMRFLIPGIAIYSIPIILSSFYQGIGRYRPLIISNLAGFIALILLSAWLIPRYVMSGAGLAASLSFFIVAGVLGLFFMRDYRLVRQALPKSANPPR